MENDKEIYCRKLGHHVPIKYCLSPGQPGFCGSFRNCWFPYIEDVDAFLKERFSEDEITAAAETSTPKITGIISVLERLKKEQAEDGEN